MKKDITYNERLDKLFEKWKSSYDEADIERFCEDGIMLKSDDSIDVNSEWEDVSRRVMFMLKDCPDGGGGTTLEPYSNTRKTENWVIFLLNI